MSIGNNRPQATLLLCAALALMCACSGQKTAAPQAAKAPAVSTDNVPATPAADNGALPAGSGKALFVINGTPVDAVELQMFIQEFKSEEVKYGARALPGMVDSFINNRVLAGMAEKEKVDRQPAVDARLAIVTNRMWGDVFWSRVVRPTVKVDEKKLRAKAPALEELISVQQLIVKTRDEAEKYRERLLKGEDFGKLIKEHSIGLTAQSEGKSGYVDKNSTMYPPDVLKQLFKLKNNEYSQVCETEIGYCVYKVTDRKSAEQLKKEWYEANREKLIGELEKNAWNEMKDKLVARHKIKLNKKAISDYLDARGKKASVAKFLNLTAVSIDNTRFTIDDLANPSGMGVIHGTETLDMLANKRIEEYAIEEETEKRGLKKEFPAIMMKEKLTRENILARSYVDFITEKYTVTEKERTDYFAKNREKFVIPRALDVSFIETKSEIRLKSIYEALGKGTPFAKVAEEWSDNKQLKGTPVPEENINPDFAAVKKLKVGEYIKEPIRLKVPGSGLSVFLVGRLDAVQEKRFQEYSEVDRAVLEKAVLSFKREEAITKLLTQIRKDNKVVFEDEYKKFEERFKKNMPTQGGGR